MAKVGSVIMPCFSCGASVAWAIEKCFVEVEAVVLYSLGYVLCSAHRTNVGATTSYRSAYSSMLSDMRIWVYA